MFSNLYENDILDLDTLNDLERVSPLKSNKAIKRAAKKFGSDKETTVSINKGNLSTKPVEAHCNKCDAKIIGDLVADIYISSIDKMIPFISYACTACGHIGKRSVMTLALPLEQYERKYFN